MIAFDGLTASDDMITDSSPNPSNTLAHIANNGDRANNVIDLTPMQTAINGLTASDSMSANDSITPAQIAIVGMTDSMTANVCMTTNNSVLVESSLNPSNTLAHIGKNGDKANNVVDLTPAQTTINVLTASDTMSANDYRTTITPAQTAIAGMTVGESMTANICITAIDSMSVESIPNPDNTLAHKA